MCVVAIAYLASDRYPLVVAANRDERYERPSTRAQWWEGPPGILAGRDLLAGGSWLGVASSGRFAAVTNIFERPRVTAAQSRGALVREFLRSDEPAAQFARAAADHGDRYGPFNLLLAAEGRLWFASNRSPPTELPAGIHACSNNRPGTTWPKLAALKARLAEALAESAPVERLLEHLCGAEARGTLDTAAESIFVAGADFGTRCSTVLTVDADGRAQFVERSFLAEGTTGGTVSFDLSLPALVRG